MSDLTIAQRVEAGAAWLDEHKPGWWHTINLATLDISSDCNCVLGQTYGSYLDAPDTARWDDGRWVAEDLGFSALSFLTRAEEREDYAALAEAWRTLIEERRSGIPA